MSDVPDLRMMLARAQSVGEEIANSVSHGVGFVAAKRLRYGHFVWHLFVLVGTVCHFIAVGFYAA